MRRMRSKLNNLVYPTEGGVNAPQAAVQGVGPNRQTSAIQSQLQAVGIYPQQMMPEMYGPGGYAQPYEQQPYPHMQQAMHPGMQQGMVPQMPMAQQMQMPQHAQQQAAMAQPNLYSVPQQMAQSAVAPEMDSVTAGLERLSANIQQLAANNPAGAQDASQVQKQNEMITAELMELRKQIAISSGQGNNQDLVSQMEAIRQAVEAALAKSANPEVFASAVEASHNKICDELYEFKNALSNNNANPEIFAHTFEARHDEISRSINDLQHSINAAIGNPGLYAETVENSHRQLSQQFEDFKHTMLERSAANQQVDEPDFSALEMRLEEITRAIVALSAGNQGQDGIERIEARISDLAKTISTPQVGADTINVPNYDEHFNQVHHNLQMLDSRLNELQTAESSDTGALDAQIQQISEKMDVLSAANNQVNEVSLHGVEELEQHISILSEKIDNIASISNERTESQTSEGAVSGDNSALIGRLDELVGEVVHLRTDNTNDQAMTARMNDLVGQLESFNAQQLSGDAHTDQIIAHLKELSQSVDNLTKRDASALQNVDLSPLETQLSQISQHLNNGAQNVSVEGLPIDEISQRLIGIEQQIGASRDIAIELASQAASDAVQRTMNEMPAGVASGEGVDNSAIQKISENINSLNEQTASAHAQYIEEFDAMKSSLTQLAERNNKLESKLENLDTASDPFESNDCQEQSVVLEEEIHIEPQHEEVQYEEPQHEEVQSEGLQHDQSTEVSDVSQFTEVLEQAHSEPQTESNIERAQATLGQSPLVTQFENIEVQEEYAPEEGLAYDNQEELMQESAPQRKETSTDDLINKIRENARAEQSYAEENAAVNNPSNLAEKVLAEAAGLNIDAIASDVEYHPDMAHQAYESTLTQELNPAIDNLSSAEFTQRPEETMTLSVPEQAMPMQSQIIDSHQILPEVDVPSLDAEHEDDLPLEPGSVGPDLAALVRQVNERRMDGPQNNSGGTGSDFLASARRAAQAAAQEANLVEEKIEQKEEKSFLAKLPGLLAKKKKLLLMGVAAVAIIAIAMPFIMGSSDSTTEELASEKTVIIENSATAEADASVFSDEPVIEESQTSVDGENQEITIDDTVDNNTIESAADVQTQVETAMVVPEASEQNVISEASTIESENNAASKYDVSELNFVSAGLKEAVEQGNPIAMFEVGRQYTNGETTKKDLTKAATWYQRAANEGHVPAQYMIGNFNEKGFGMEPNVQNAVTWYEKAANQGNVIAMHNLGVLYATPGKLNAQPNMEKAFIWFKQAADHGVRDSQVNMGIFYTQGLGTEVNLSEAYKWFSIASVDGDADAKKKLSIIEERLRPEQKQAAKTMIESWKSIKADPAANEVNTPDSWKANSEITPIVKIDRKTIQQTQAILNKLGYTAGNPDGLMGKQTKAAISKYQKTEGLKITGTINPELVKSLISKMSG